MISFFVEGTPITQGSKQAFVRGGRAVLFDMSNKKRGGLPAGRLDRWRAKVAAVAKVYMGDAESWDGPIKLDLEFYLQRPASHYTKVSKRLTKSAPRHHVSRPDKGKLARAVEDAMSGIVYGDDSQVCAGQVEKHYAHRDSDPGVLVHVRRMM